MVPKLVTMLLPLLLLAAKSHNVAPAISFPTKAAHYIAKHIDQYKEAAGVALAHLLEDDLLAEEPEDYQTWDEEEEPEEHYGSSNNDSQVTRRKRAVILQDDIPNLARTRRKIVDHESEGTFVIQQVNRATPQYFDSTMAIDINCQKIEDKTFVFSIENTPAGRELMMHQLNDRDLGQRLLSHKLVPDAMFVDAFKIKDQLYVFTTENHEPQTDDSKDIINAGSTLFQVINPASSSWTLAKQQRIYLPFAKASALWTGMGTEANEMFLALAPEKIVSDGKTSYNVLVQVYRWQGGYFDGVSSFPALNPQSIQHLAMFSHDYLAVANYQDNSGSTSVYSEIFKYDHKELRFVSFQRVQTYGAKDIRHFTFSDAEERRHEHFIAIANSCTRDENGKLQYWVQSSIMKFGGARFFPFKSFYTYGAQAFLPVKDGQTFFLALADFHSLRLFQYNGWTFVETYSKKFSEQHDVTSPFSISLRQPNSKLDGKSYFTVASPNRNVENGMFGVTFETRNDHRKLVTSVEAWCNGASKQVANTDLSNLESRLNAAPKVSDSRVVIRGELRFDKGLKVGQLKSQSLRMGRGRSLDHEKFQQLAFIEREYKALTNDLNTIDQQMAENVVWVNKQEPQQINGPVVFRNDVNYNNEAMQLKHLQVKRTMNSVNVNDHLNNVIFLNEPQTFKSITSDKIITNDAFITNLNGRPLGDYAHVQPSSDKQVFKGNNEFKEIKITRELQVGNSFAGLSFVQPQFLLYHSNQTFPGATMQLTNSKVNHLYTRILNDKDLFTMYADAVSLEGGVIKANKHFLNADKGVAMKNAEVTTINDKSISSLYDNAIYVTGPAATQQRFTTPVQFESMEIESIAPANPNINDQFDMNLNFFKIAGASYTVKDMKFEKATTIDELFVKSRLNNVKVLEEQDQLDLLLRNSNEAQRVKSKSLNSIHLTQNTEAEELVDDVDLARWSHVQTIELSENAIQGAINILSGHVLADGGVIVGKSFKQNNQDVARVLQNSARLDAETLPGSCDLSFDNLQVKGNSDIRNRLNNVQPSQWVINSQKATQLDVTGEKVFEGPVHLLKDVNAKGLFGRMADNNERENLLSVFPTLLLNGVDQTILDEMAFGGKFVVDQASCPNAILDRVPFENLLLKKGNQVVEIETLFRQPFTAQGDVHVERDVTTELVNGMHINNQLKNTLMTDQQLAGGPQTVKGFWQFEELRVTDATEVIGTIASSDVQTLYGDIIRKDSDVIQLDGMNLQFEKGAVIQRAEFLGQLNGIPSTEWGHAWLLSRSDQVVETKVVFAKPVSANSFKAPSVNGLDIKHFSESILRIDRDESLATSSMSFQGPVTAQSGISMPNGANVNGIDLAKDVLLKNSNEMQTVTAEKTFKNGATFKGNLFVNELMGFDIANFANLVSNEVEGQTSSSLLRINGDLKLEEEPEVTSSMNEHSWEQLQNEIWMRRGSVVLNNPVKFSSVKLHQGGELGNSATLNGLDLNHFEKNYASKTRDQKWTGQVTMNIVDNANTLAAKSVQLENDGKFNDVDLQRFYDSRLRYTGDQEIVADALTADSLVVNRLDGLESNGDNVNINSVSVKQDLMTVSGENIVTVAKKLKNLKAKTLTLSDDTVMDGVNLGKWSSGAVMRTGSYNFEGPLSFDSLETVENVVVDGAVDNVNFNLDNVLTTDNDQVVPNQVIIKQSSQGPAVKAPAGVEFKGKVNGINVQEKFSKMIFKDDTEQSAEPIVIKDKTVFNAPLVLNQVKTEALFHGQDVSALLDTMSRAHEEVHNNAFNANQRYNELLGITKRMLAVSEKRAVFLDYFVLTQKIKIASTYVKVLRNVGHPVIAMGFKQSDRITTENWWSYSTPVDYYQLQIGNRVKLEGLVTDIAELSQGSSNMFVFAVNNESDERPAQAHALEMINSNNVQNVEISKSSDKLSKAFILKSVDVGTPNMRPAISQVIFSHGFKSVKSFTLVTNDDSLVSCMAATTKRVNEMDSSVKILCMNTDSEAFEVVQGMNLDSPSMMTTTKAPNSESTLLAILTRSQETQPEGLLEIWSYTRQSIKKGNSIQFFKQSCLPVFNVISLDSMTTEDGKTFLSVASGALSDTEYQGSVFIYRYISSLQQFQKVQTVETKHPLDVKFQSLKVSNEVILYVLSESVTNNVQVYKRQGLSGWSPVHQFTSENGKSLEVADFTMDGVYRAQLLVTSPSQTSIYAAEFMGINTVIEEELMEQTNEVSTSLREFVDFDNL